MKTHAEILGLLERLNKAANVFATELNVSLNLLVDEIEVRDVIITNKDSRIAAFQTENFRLHDCLTKRDLTIEELNTQIATAKAEHVELTRVLESANSEIRRYLSPPNSTLNTLPIAS